jgi:hypothetical protein
MFKPLVVSFLVACSVGATSAPEKDLPRKPPEDIQEAQHFCCHSVDHKARSGEGCTAISGSLETINACQYVLFCPEYWTKEDGKVTCE